MRFRTEFDLDILSQGVSVRLIRVLATIQLETASGWTKEYRAIVDTGNPISIIPFSIWNQAQIRPLIRENVRLYGLGSNEKSALSGHLAEVTCILKDVQKTSPPLKIKAYLLKDDRSPFLIGFEDILTEIKLVSDYKRKYAFLEI